MTILECSAVGGVMEQEEMVNAVIVQARDMMILTLFAVPVEVLAKMNAFRVTEWDTKNATNVMGMAYWNVANVMAMANCFATSVMGKEKLK